MDPDPEHWYMYIILQRQKVIKKSQNSSCVFKKEKEKLLYFATVWESFYVSVGYSMVKLLHFLDTFFLSFEYLNLDPIKTFLPDHTFPGILT
jgi:hypothetical protein